MRGDWSVVEGDCVAAMAGLGPGSARLVFADPPSNKGVDYGDGAGADRLPPEVYLAWCRRWMDAAKNLLTPDGSLWGLICPEWVGRFQCLLEDLGLYWRETIVWHETFGNGSDPFLSAHTTAVLLVSATGSDPSDSSPGGMATRS